MSFSHSAWDLLIEHVNEAEKLLEISGKYIYASRDHLKTIRMVEEGCIKKKYTNVR